ncbi:MAG: RNA-binding protein [Pseudomonadota bacterium]|nr:RNA-binding protein [Pseudomonadota bacterium]
MVFTQRDLKKPKDWGSPARRCIVSGRIEPITKLIRFVVGPDNVIVADISKRLPGRGLWTLAAKDIVNEALARRKFDKAAKCSVLASADLADKVELSLLQSCLNIVGLARRAGCAVSGYEKSRAVITSGKAVLVIVTTGASTGSRKQLLSGRPNLAVLEIFNQYEVGKVFGKDRVVFAAITDAMISNKLRDEAGRLAGFRNSLSAPDKC